MILFLLKIGRRLYGKVFGLKLRTFFNRFPPENNGQESSDLIYDILASNKPCMISRLGNVEFKCVYFYKINKNNIFKKYIKYIKYIIGDIDDVDWTPKMKHELQHNAGFFTATSENLEKFSQRMLKDIVNIDILASGIDYENEFKEELKNAATIGFEDLNSYNHKNPWSRVLKNKKVLVIHPFAESIQSQYKRREFLFENKEVLPDFELITYKPVQSIAGNFESTGFKDWFEALSKMENDIGKIDFDIAIIGCGAYGLPLASFVKKIGKQGVHIGGAVQILFGIIGRRWETEYDLTEHINEYWIRPSSSEIPKNFKNVEEGCYW
ncbi:hypothetical protein [Flavobacterium sp.]|uniref:hypothetical protein n=1 Tax=Flavobacterium sp. TaxID=239 RepID=UPI00374FDE21